MFGNRPWSGVALLRLASGLLFAFGISSLLSLALISLFGNSEFTSVDIQNPVTVSRAILGLELQTNTAVSRLRVLATPPERATISTVTNAAPNSKATPAVLSALTNVLNRALQDARFPAVSPVQKSPGPDTESNFFEARRARRLAIQEAFPQAIRPIPHRFEVESEKSHWYPFVLSNLSLQIGFFWVLSRFLKDEQLTWRQFLTGNASQPITAVPVGIVAALIATPLLLIISQISTWFWTLWNHDPVLQQPLLVLQQARSPFEHLFFAYLALIGAPLFEESFFRGLLFPALRQFGWNRAAWIISAAVFGLVHFDREKFLPLTVFAFLQIALFQRTRTLLAPIACHATFNGINFLLFLFETPLEQWVHRLTSKS